MSSLKHLAFKYTLRTNTDSFNTYNRPPMSIYYMPATVLGTGVTSLKNKTKQISPLKEGKVGERTINKINKSCIASLRVISAIKNNVKRL